ncbi:response regulator [Candidatus Azambacteria bacterium]|nr:response regulator [Candidatus Azambacteria bacterium]
MNRVLVVEDEEFLAKALKDSLSFEGYAVDVVGNGDEAINKVRSDKPNIILLDLLLPKKSGLEVVEEIKSDPDLRLIPVIVLSNLSGDAEIKRALEIGADDYFVKSQHPIEEVIDRVKGYIEGARKPTKNVSF